MSSAPAELRDVAPASPSDTASSKYQWIIAPAVFALTSLAIMVFSFVDNNPETAVWGLRKESLWGLLIMVAGIPLYLIMRWRDRGPGQGTSEAPRA